MAKTPNIKKPIGNNCSRGPKVHLYQFVGKLDNFPRNAYKLSLEKLFFLNTYSKIAKNDRFWPKKGHFSADFAEILGIDENYLNTCYVNILGHLGHFLAKYGHFCSFLAHFGLYNYIGEMPAEPHIS